MTKFNLWLIEPNHFLREGMRYLLQETAFNITVAEATAEQAVEAAGDDRPDILIWGPGTTHIASAEIAWVRDTFSFASGARFAWLTDLSDADRLRRVAASGVDAILSQDISVEILLRSLDLIMLGQQLFPAVTQSIAAEPVQPPIIVQGRARGIERDSQAQVALSTREGQILQCLVNGASNKAIARDLRVTEATVKAHVKGLLRKIRVINRTQAAIWALNNGVVPQDAPEPASTVALAADAGRCAWG